MRRRFVIATTLIGGGLINCSLLTTIDDDVSSGNGATSNEGGAAVGDSNAPDQTESGGPAANCAGAEGPSQVRVEIASGVHYCIDSTEVTRRHYLKFLTSSPTTSNPRCSYKMGGDPFRPEGVWPPIEATQDLPVTNVDWCDAETFCKWAGKKLCGSYTTTPLTRQTAGSFDRSILAHACSGGGKTKYPYGDSFEPGRCNDNTLGKGEPIAVGTSPRCEGGFPGIFDLSGNVVEWTAHCEDEGMNGDNDTCIAFNSPYYEQMSNELVCSFTRTDLVRSNRHDYVGFRCCSE